MHECPAYLYACLCTSQQPHLSSPMRDGLVVLHAYAHAYTHLCMRERLVHTRVSMHAYAHVYTHPNRRMREGLAQTRRSTGTCSVQTLAILVVMYKYAVGQQRAINRKPGNSEL